MVTTTPEIFETTFFIYRFLIIYFFWLLSEIRRKICSSPLQFFFFLIYSYRCCCCYSYSVENEEKNKKDKKIFNKQFFNNNLYFVKIIQLNEEDRKKTPLKLYLHYGYHNGKTQITYIVVDLVASQFPIFQSTCALCIVGYTDAI